MTRLVHFEIHAENLERAMKFYQEVFDWKFEKWDGAVTYWMIITGPKETPGINGGLVLRQGPAPQGGEPMNGYVCTMKVDNVDTYVEKITSQGGTIAVAKTAVPQVGYLAYCKDTEGNIFGLMQADPNVQ